MSVTILFDNKGSGGCHRMRSARNLLLVSILALASAADTSTDVTVPTLTLSPEANFLIDAREDLTTSPPASNSNAPSQPPTAPATESPATIPTTASKTIDATSGQQSTAESPSNTSATKSSDSPLDRDSGIKSEAEPSMPTSSKSSTAVDTLNDSEGGLRTGGKSSVGIVLPFIFGALACAGAIVMAVTYKKKREGNSGENHSSLSRDYTNGAVITPDNQALGTVQEDYLSAAMKMSDLCHVDIRRPSTNASDNLSPFDSARCKVRVSSSNPVSSEPDMEFPDPYSRHVEGSNVVLTFEEVSNLQNSAVPQVQL